MQGEASGNGLSQFELLEASGPTQVGGCFVWCWLDGLVLATAGQLEMHGRRQPQLITASFHFQQPAGATALLLPPVLRRRWAALPPAAQARRRATT